MSAVVLPENPQLLLSESLLRRWTVTPLLRRRLCEGHLMFECVLGHELEVLHLVHAGTHQDAQKQVAQTSWP